MGELDAGVLVRELRDVFETGKTKSAQWRVQQLKAIVKMMYEREKEISEALNQDMRKPSFESYVAELHITRDAASFAAKNLTKWMVPEKAATTTAAAPSSAAIVSEPLGVVLVISAWNFPFMLSLDPVVGAIAAGNAVVLKPSELAPASSALLAKLLPLYVDSSAIRVVEGGIPETTALLDQRWDKIFYTGSTKVGKIIMAAAAKHLTPVTLELGGKSPAIIDSTVDLQVTARRLAWGKWASNNGQACVAPDYVLAEESIVPKLINKLKDTLKEFYGDDPSCSENISRVINDTHFRRLVGLLSHEGTSDKIIHGGQTDEKNLFIAPTLILDPPQDSPIMQEEIFGPLLVIITVRNVDEAIKIVNCRPKPLSLYLFSTDKKVVEQVVQQTSSGGVTVNDTIMHITQPSLPFGGVGDSGMGGYHGKHSFDTFSHRKAVLYRKMMLDTTVRYPPYTAKNQSMIKSLLNGDFIGIVLAYLGLK